MITNYTKFIESINNVFTLSQFIIEVRNIITPSIEKVIKNYLYREFIISEKQKKGDNNYKLTKTLDDFYKENKEYVDAEIENQKNSLVYFLLYRMGYYYTVDSKFEIISIDFGHDGNLNVIIKIDGEILETTTIFAGGWNVQKLHYRFLVKTKIRISNDSISKNIDKKSSEDKKLIKSISKLEKELTINNKSIEKWSKEYSKNDKFLKLYSDNKTKELFKIMIDKFEKKEPISDIVFDNKLDKKFEIIEFMTTSNKPHEREHNIAYFSYLLNQSVKQMIYYMKNYSYKAYLYHNLSDEEIYDKEKDYITKTIEISSERIYKKLNEIYNLFINVNIEYTKKKENIDENIKDLENKNLEIEHKITEIKTISTDNIISQILKSHK